MRMKFAEYEASVKKAMTAAYTRRFGQSILPLRFHILKCGFDWRAYDPETGSYIEAHVKPGKKLRVTAEHDNAT